MAEQQTFDQWAILEIMGHVKLAGRVSEQTIAGTGFLRIDVPEANGLPAFTRLYGTGAIYSITPVSEDFARQAAASLQERAVMVYIPAIAAPARGVGDFDDEDDDDDMYRES